MCGEQPIMFRCPKCFKHYLISVQVYQLITRDVYGCNCVKCDADMSKSVRTNYELLVERLKKDIAKQCDVNVKELFGRKENAITVK